MKSKRVSYGLGITKYFLSEMYYRKDINSTIIRLKTSFHQRHHNESEKTSQKLLRKTSTQMSDKELVSRIH